jgi:SAM-dependent methyltransferase
MSRRVLLAVSLFVLSVGAFAQDSGYKRDLIAKFPFYKMARGQFAPVYPALARQLVGDYGVTKGVCVDIGGAEGSLAVELAKITDLTVYVVDISPAAVRLCNLLADEAGLTGRVRAIEGDAQSLPLRDGFADLVVSRNSLFEWPDRQAGLLEAYRIMKPGGVAYMGGGFSRLLDPVTLKPLVDAATRKRAQHPDTWTEMDPQLVSKLKAAGVSRARVIEGPTPFDWWLEMRK